MSEAPAVRIHGSGILWEPLLWYGEAYTSLPETQKWSWGWHYIKNLAQDQVIIRISRGSRIDTYRGLHVGTDEDSQSDYADAIPARFTHKEINTVFNLVKQRVDNKINLDWESDESFVDEEMMWLGAVEEQVDALSIETTADDVSQWTSDQLASAILHHLEAEVDMPRLREMILIAEDTGFSVEESEQLAPWLLSFAERYRDRNDPQDEAAVWSAIRTGASMLRPDAADCLRPLLEPGHSIETSLVTVKMLGRIFEAQPPTKVDEHPHLANEVCPAAEIVRNRYAITSSRSAAIAQLAIYALAAMASSEIHRIVKDVQELGVAWFTQQTLHELCELANIWTNHPVPVADQPQKLLDRAIQILE